MKSPKDQKIYVSPPPKKKRIKSQNTSNPFSWNLKRFLWRRLHQQSNCLPPIYWQNAFSFLWTFPKCFSSLFLLFLCSFWFLFPNFQFCFSLLRFPFSIFQPINWSIFNENLFKNGQFFQFFPGGRRLPAPPGRRQPLLHKNFFWKNRAAKKHFIDFL